MAIPDLSLKNLPSFSGPALSQAERAFAAISVVTLFHKIPATRIAKFQAVLTALKATGSTPNAKLAADALAAKLNLAPPFGTPAASRPNVLGGWPRQAAS